MKSFYFLVSVCLFYSCFDYFSGDKDLVGNEVTKVIRVGWKERNKERKEWFNDIEIYGFEPYKCWKEGGSDYEELEYKEIGEKIKVDVKKFKIFLNKIIKRLEKFPLHERFKDWLLRHVFGLGKDKIDKETYIDWEKKMNDEQILKYAEDLVRDVSRYMELDGQVCLSWILHFDISDMGCDVCLDDNKVDLDFTCCGSFEDECEDGTFIDLLHFDEDGKYKRDGDYKLGVSDSKGSARIPIRWLHTYIKNRQTNKNEEELLPRRDKGSYSTLFTYFLKKEGNEYKYIDENGKFKDNYYINLEIDEDAQMYNHSEVFKDSIQEENKESKGDEITHRQIERQKCLQKQRQRQEEEKKKKEEKKKDVDNINIQGASDTNDCCGGGCPCCPCCPCGKSRLR